MTAVAPSVTTEPIPGSRKGYLEGPDGLRVPVRRGWVAGLAHTDQARGPPTLIGRLAWQRPHAAVDAPIR